MSIKHSKEWAKAKLNRLEQKYTKNTIFDWNGWSRQATDQWSNGTGLRTIRRMERIANRYGLWRTAPF
jgi:hypothetical protein